MNILIPMAGEGSRFKQVGYTIPKPLIEIKGKPIVILMYTEMGNGVDFMMGTHKWHGSAPNDEQLQIALSQNQETLGDY